MHRFLMIICWLLLGYVGGAIATNWFALVTVPAGDWLAFVGGLLGVSLTILGTVALEQWKRDTDKLADRQLVIGALEKLAQAMDQIPPGDEQPGALRWDSQKASALLGQINEATELIEYARANSRLTTVEQVLAINKAEKAISDAHETLEREGRWIETHGDKPNVLEQFNLNIRGVAEMLRPTIIGAIQALKS